MEFIKEKGMLIVLAVTMFSITMFGAWSMNKLDNVSVEVEPEYVVANMN